MVVDVAGFEFEGIRGDGNPGAEIAVLEGRAGEAEQAAGSQPPVRGAASGDPELGILRRSGQPGALLRDLFHAQEEAPARIDVLLDGLDRLVVQVLEASLYLQVVAHGLGP